MEDLKLYNELGDLIIPTKKFIMNGEVIVEDYYSVVRKDKSFWEYPRLSSLNNLRIHEVEFGLERISMDFPAQENEEIYSLCLNLDYLVVLGTIGGSIGSFFKRAFKRGYDIQTVGVPPVINGDKGEAIKKYVKIREALLGKLYNKFSELKQTGETVRFIPLQ